MGLAVHNAVIIRNDRLGRRIVIPGIVAQGTMLHLGKPPVGGLGQNIRLQFVPLQLGAGLLIGSIAEAAIAPARGSDGVIPAVRIFIADGFRQFLKEIVGAVIQPIHIFLVAVICFCHVCVDAAARLAHGLAPVIPGIMGVLTGGAVQNRAFSLTVYHGSVRILDVAAHRRCAVPCVFRGAERKERGLLLTFSALESLMGDRRIDVQFIGPVVGLLPMLGGVMVAVLLGGKSRGDKAQAQDQHQHQGQRPPLNMNSRFQIRSSYTLKYKGKRKMPSGQSVPKGITVRWSAPALSFPWAVFPSIRPATPESGLSSGGA